jgi:hypothetical protein
VRLHSCSLCASSSWTWLMVVGASVVAITCPWGLSASWADDDPTSWRRRRTCSPCERHESHLHAVEKVRANHACTHGKFPFTEIT